MQHQGLEEGSAAAAERGVSIADRLFSRLREELLARARATPLSTYRLQLHKGFTFQDARALVPYLTRLGVSDFYASPYLKATPGSTHGYDCVDHQHLNPEVGSPEDHEALCHALREQGLGQVLDVVPNHMGIERFNALWFDVLENGPSSMYAKYFDIDWAPVKAELRDKVLLPILGDQYGIVLENGELKLGYRGGALFIHYYDHLLPLAPRQYGHVLRPGLQELEARLGTSSPHLIELQSILTAIEHLPSRTETERAKVIERNREKEVIKRRLAAVVAASPEVAAFVNACVESCNGTPGNPRSFDRLDALLTRCSYRLAHWRVAGEEINYRRFFDINGLAAIRVEEPEVFDEAHARIFDWLREGYVTGLRIDHPDGLFDPTAYFLRLQERFFLEQARKRFQEEFGDSDTRWPVVEPRLLERWRTEVAEEPNSPLLKALYVVVEKIQGGRERIPEAWAVHGTTGYRFANSVGGVFVHPDAEEPLDGDLPPLHRRGAGLRGAGPPEEAAHHEHGHVERDQHARLRAEPHLGDEPAHAGLHAQQPAPRAGGVHRPVPRLPHLRGRLAAGAGRAGHRSTSSGPSPEPRSATPPPTSASTTSCGTSSCGATRSTATRPSGPSCCASP